MGKWCPIVNHAVVYLTCQECSDRVCEKGKPSNKCVSCDTCLNYEGEIEDTLFGQKTTLVNCKIYNRNIFTKADKAKTGCPHYNVDLSNEKICLNCEHFLGGGDWGLACAADYYKLPDTLSKACDKFEKKI